MFTETIMQFFHTVWTFVYNFTWTFEISVQHVGGMLAKDQLGKQVLLKRNKILSMG